ncbi:CRAL/TRIO domain-containing protein [Pseudomassariella vexata]|uniref:CRAL/TRIO domain-containing protein n=1 Tax=Pseudomassariella vexata TaxID=1141098 RepID=A0A1Y2EK75_9PEZI|nr:CRAL/TRIO domain-containing protein [Pseudomassariella vexata]ORY71938.1 CRAL/TRIO domain-containing protein [Pseudomassariella vexata]
MATAATASSSAVGDVEKGSAGGPLKTPIVAPVTNSKPVEKPELAKDQQTKYDWLLEKAKGWTEVPSTQGKAGPLTDHEKLWLTRDCLLRYLRAVKWNEKEAEKRILGTLTWRREYGVEALTADHISPENETGKQIQLGYDKQGRPCHYLNPGRQNTDPSPRQVQHLVFMLERVIELMPPQQETLSLLINFKTSKSRSNTAPGIGQGREVLNILQTHYPERLGRALIINVPWVVWGFFKLITPFIDPLTREKLKFNEDMSQYVPKEQLWTEFGGDLQFDYDHAVYWPAMQKLCAEKQAERQKRWEAGGKQIGELEDYLTGHVAQGIAPPSTYQVAVEANAAPEPEDKVGETAAQLGNMKVGEAITTPEPSQSPLEGIAEAKEPEETTK